MGIKLKYDNIQYKQNKNTVVCIIKGVFGADFLSLRRFTVSGIATTKNEEFNLEKGKRLALARAELAANLFYEDCIKKYIRRYENKIKEATQKHLKVRNYIEHKKSYIRKF